ncbi:uncharacterized protein LOC119596251 [Penaeus monodon]|uniref:uncharacterized protein LOC119596251 n=1 Tax=Penaeus monodon TaxID=6687 RepID=UPI0018A7B733|nr:uncharacterized protein LOC119596251 [Penaeus monodon]
MKDNSTQWSQGLRFVQWKKNTFHSGIGRTPYEAMYGQKARLGVDATSVPEEVLDGMQTEEQLESRSQSIHTEQMKSRIEQQKQAQKMIDNSVRRFQPAKVGDTVVVPVPLVDRGRAEFANVKADVFQTLDNGTYKHDDVQEREVSLREVAIAESMGQGQGFAKCSCTKSCMTRRRKC